MNNTLIIAEAGVNHNGSLELAKEMIDVAAEAGVDVIKFQTFKTEEVITKNAKKAEYQEAATGSDETQYEMVKKLELSDEDHLELINYCKKQNIDFLSTPFDIPSVDLLVDRFNLPMLKIPSGEITNAPLLLRMARSGKPLILSTGMSLLGDIEDCLGVLAFGYLTPNGEPSVAAFREAYLSNKGQKTLKEKVSILHCTTEYPTAYEDINLPAMETLKCAFGLPFGFSDHSPGIAAPIAAVARGATIIEKHFTLDKKMEGPDHAASLNPVELVAMTKGIREVEMMLGHGKKIPVASELKNLPIARKSLVARCDIKAGDIFTEDNLTAKRPGTGISPMEYWVLLGTAAKKDIDADEQVEN